MQYQLLGSDLVSSETAHAALPAGTCSIACCAFRNYYSIFACDLWGVARLNLLHASYEALGNACLILSA